MTLGEWLGDSVPVPVVAAVEMEDNKVILPFRDGFQQFQQLAIMFLGNPFTGISLVGQGGNGCIPHLSFPLGGKPISVVSGLFCYAD